MKKFMVLFFVLYSINAFAYYTETIPNMCGVLGNDLFAVFTINTYECASGYYLPANVDGCRACPTNYICSGGTYTFNETEDQGAILSLFTCASGYYLPANSTNCVACPSGYTCSGGTFLINPDEFQGAEKSSDYITQNLTNMCAANIDHDLLGVFTPNVHNCNPGYYLPANTDGCRACPTNYICSGGTYTFNETVAQGIQSCPGNTPHSPSGSAVCYAHVMHVGDDVMYMRSTKLTTPSLNIKIGNDIFYINMTTVPSFMNKNSLHYFKAMYNDTLYYVCDDTTFPGVE